MQWLHHVWNYVIWSIFLAILSIPINVILLTLRWCSIKYIRHLCLVRRALVSAPEDMLLRSDGKNVVFVTYNSDGVEEYQPFYSGVLTWKSGQRLVKKLRVTVDKQLRYRIATWAIVLLPICLGAVYWTLHDASQLSSEEYSGRLIAIAFGVFCFGFHQFVPFTFFLWPGLREFFDTSG